MNSLRHLVEYIESTRQIKRKPGEIVSRNTAGHGSYGIVEEPCVSHGWVPPLTILPPIDNTIRRYDD